MEIPRPPRLSDRVRHLCRDLRWDSVHIRASATSSSSLECCAHDTTRTHPAHPVYPVVPKLLTLNTALFTLAATLALQLGWGYWNCRQNALAPGHARISLLPPLAAYGIAQIAALTPATLNAQLDQLVLSQTVAAAVLGRYAIAVSLTCLPIPLVAAIGNVAFPRLAAQQVVTDATRRMQHHAIVASAGIAAAMLVPLAAVAYWLIPFVFGAGYRGAVPLLWILTPGAIFLACGQVAGDLLRGGIGRLSSPGHKAWPPSYRCSAHRPPPDRRRLRRRNRLNRRIRGRVGGHAPFATAPASVTPIATPRSQHRQGSRRRPSGLIAHAPQRPLQWQAPLRTWLRPGAVHDWPRIRDGANRSRAHQRTPPLLNRACCRQPGQRLIRQRVIDHVMVRDPFPGLQPVHGTNPPPPPPHPPTSMMSCSRLSNGNPGTTLSVFTLRAGYVPLDQATEESHCAHAR